MEIHVLNDELVSQIAAGEVVERPASVVKELIENAVDAGAGTITIRIQESGLGSIEVADNGKGIRCVELELAITRHATSKLRQVDDLYQIRSLGFRGEALASIASVSRMRLVSRAAAEEMGGEIVVDGGKASQVKAVGVPQGTVVKVDDLFFNVPPRLAFLKTPSTEKNRINELVYRYALAYPQIRWQLFHDGKPILQTSGNGDRREILADLYGVAVSRDMIEVNLHDGDSHVFGYISPVTITRSNRREITFFVNGRWVLDIGISAALLQAYGHLLPPKRYPIAVIFVEMDPMTVDVNVHPSKAEVRFKDNGMVFTTVQRAVRRAFLAFTPINENGELAGNVPPTTTTRPWSGVIPEKTIDPAWTLAALLKEEEQRAQQPDALPARIVDPETGEVALIAAGMELLRFIGEMRNRYILAEGPDGLYLIDECAAQERIVYEDFLQALSETGLQTQEVSATVDTTSVTGLESWMEGFKKLGFSLESFGPNVMRVREAPMILDQIDISLLLKNLIPELDGQDQFSFEERTEWLLMRIAFWVGEQYESGGSSVSLREMLSRLQVCRSPRVTPGGQATMIHLSLDVLTRQFGQTSVR